MVERLCIHTCDKCGKKMKKEQPVLIIAEGRITKAGRELLEFWGSCIRYACHLECWDGEEKIIL